MAEEKAQERVAAERSRVEAALAELTSEVRDDGALQRQQASDTSEPGEDLQARGVEMALIEDLRGRLKAVEGAEERLAAGTYGLSVDSGLPIPADRLAAAPLAERTVEEQRTLERGGEAS